MLQTVSWFMQLIELVFLCRRQKPLVMLSCVTGFIGILSIIYVDRRYLTPKPIGYLASFAIGAHYLFLTTMSVYIGLWFVFCWKYSEYMYKLQRYFLIGSLLLTVFGFINGFIIRNSHYTIYSDKISSDTRIVHITDLHLSNIYGAQELSKLVDRVNELNPDIVCITGDMFTKTLSIQIDLDEVYNELGRLNPKYCTFVSQGNHDEKLMDSLQELCNKSGLILLDDKSNIVNGITFVGRYCSPAGKDLSEYMLGTNYTVVMDHKPDRLKEANDVGANLILCGHTHGNQLISIKIMFDMAYEISTGAKWYDDDTFVSVGQGAYLIYPYCRIESKSEITCIDIKSK